MMASHALADDNNADVFTGDTKLSCEAILCLSTGKRPDECEPSLTRYFKINEKTFTKTIKERKKFLKLCPASDEPGMPELTNDILNGAGRCDSQYLNQNLVETKIFRKCRGTHEMESCITTTKYRISNVLPQYCQVYLDNQFTDLGLKYSGQMEWQEKKIFIASPAGQWVTE